MAREGTSKSQRRAFPWVIFFGAMAVMVVLCLAAGLGIWVLSRTGPIPEVVTSLLLPQNGRIIQENDSIEVEAVSSDPSGVSRLEVYDNGALVLVQDTSLAGGSNPLVLNGVWMPQTTGRHVLVARGYSTDERFSDSGAVIVDVVDASTTEINVDEIPRNEGEPLPSLNQVSTASGVPLDGLLNANPTLSGYDPATPLPPGTNLIMPPPPGPPPAADSGTPPPAPRPGTPTAPSNLTAPADCTSVYLSWADSPDEEQYVVYRLSAAETSPRAIATLPANTTSYNDTIPIPGASVYYQVAARRGQMEGLSLMAIATSPTTCGVPTPSPGTTDLALTLLSLETNNPFAGIHCYANINGSRTERIPPGRGEIYHDRNNVRLFPLNTGANRGRYLLNAHPVNSSVTLSAECMGVERDTAVPLGVVNASHPQADWNSSERVAEGGTFRVRYCIGPASTYCGTILAPGLPSYEIMPWLYSPHNLRIGYSTEHCGEYRGSFGLDALRCIFGPGFPPQLGEPVLAWDWTPNPRYSEPDLLAFVVAMQETGSGGRRVTHGWDITRRGGSLSFSTPAHIPGQAVAPCGWEATYTVMAVANNGARSSPSEPFRYSTRACANTADLTVRLSSVEIENYGDDRGEFALIRPARDETIEVEGMLQVVSGSESWRREFSFEDTGEGVHVHEMRTGGGGLLWARDEIPGASDWVGPGVTPEAGGLWGVDRPPSSPSQPGAGASPTDSGFFEHTVRILNDRQTVTIIVSAEEDDFNPFDTQLTHPALCGRFELPARSIAEWERFGQVLTGSCRLFDGDYTEGTATVTLNVTGRPGTGSR